METVSEKIRRLFDYRGVCANSSNTNVAIAKTSDYSPNNIRRVIISPDGVLVSFHKRLTAGRVSGSTNGNSQFAFLAFNALELNREEQSENYKPILLNLSEPRVCACVEEIIICTQSMNGVFDSGAYQREVSVGGMIKSFINKSGSIDDVVKRRFQRLRYFSLCSCTIQEVLMCCKDLNFLSNFISEHPQFSDRMQIKEYQSGEDYWKYANLQTSIYPFDAYVLSKHFHEIKEKFEAENKRAKIQEYSTGIEKEKIQNAGKEYLDYCRNADILIKFYKAVDSCGSNGLVDLSFLQKPSITPLSSFKGIEDIKGLNKRLIVDDKLDKAQAMKRNTELCSDMKKTTVDYTAGALIQALAKLADSSSQYALKTAVHELESSVVVPAEYADLMNKITSISGFNFDGRNISTSIINSCWIFCMLFLDRSS